MTPPDKCPRCGQPTPHSFTQCIVDQRDALAAQIESLKDPACVAASVLRGLIAESRGFVGDHRNLLEACGTCEIAEAVAVVEKLKARVKELETKCELDAIRELELGASLMRVKELEEALSCVMPRCEHLHHDWKYRHKAAERCPVVDLVNTAKEKP